MKKIFQLIILIICLQVNAQDKQYAITITGNGRMDTLRSRQMTVVDTKNLVRKNLSQEISLKKALDVYVTMGGLLTIKTWNENKVKLETAVWIEGNNELTDENWLDKLGITSKLSGDTVKVNTRQTEVYSFDYGVNRTMSINFDRNHGLNETVFYGNGSLRGVVNSNREITLYIPSASKLGIENKYGLLALANNINDITIINTNGEINAADIGNLELRSSSGRFIAGVIKNGNINISHGRLYLRELSNGILNTAYNTIEIEKAGAIQMNSASDDIDINEAGSIIGMKSYGTLQVSLSGNVDLEGVNSRIKLRNIAPSAELIRIFDMNTDLRIPIHELKNYAIDVRGSFINLYSSFSNKTTTDTLTSNEAAGIKVKKDSLLELAKKLGSRNVAIAGSSSITGSRPEKPDDRPERPVAIYVDGKLTYTASKDAPTNSATTITVKNSSSTIKSFRYTFKSGDAGRPTKFDITCTNCTVDFK
jgi:hypothetical protein